MRRGSVAIVGEPCQGTRCLYIRLSTCCKNESNGLAIQIDRLTLLLLGEGSDSHAWYLGFCHLYLFAGHDSRPSGPPPRPRGRKGRFRVRPCPPRQWPTTNSSVRLSRPPRSPGPRTS